MPIYDIQDATINLAQLVEAAASGEEVVIADAGQLRVRMIPVEPASKVRKFGLLKGKIEIPDDFDAPLPDEILDAFEGH